MRHLGHIISSYSYFIKSMIERYEFYKTFHTKSELPVSPTGLGKIHEYFPNEITTPGSWYALVWRRQEPRWDLLTTVIKSCGWISNQHVFTHKNNCCSPRVDRQICHRIKIIRRRLVYYYFWTLLKVIGIGWIYLHNLLTCARILKRLVSKWEIFVSSLKW